MVVLSVEEEKLCNEGVKFLLLSNGYEVSDELINKIVRIVERLSEDYDNYEKNERIRNDPTELENYLTMYWKAYGRCREKKQAARRIYKGFIIDLTSEAEFNTEHQKRYGVPYN
ncbi:hypothetical protein LCGC14_0196190 [marine sediment metagenome]|uniref:Uncharacterized protein n=1 Tax=marine sediment metagenome TaxID=412755 RepID=A0A0F9X4P1_9ZZZZ